MAITKIGCAEYLTAYLRDNGIPFCASQSAWPPVMTDYPISGIVGLDGGQYHCVAWNAAGQVWELDNQANATPVGNDTNGDSFTGNTYVKPLYHCNISIRSGSLWYWGYGDILNQFGGTTPIAAPRPLVMPEGKVIKKIEAASATTPGDLTFLWGLATDGTLWQWDRTHTTPFQVSIAGKTIADIAMVGPKAFVVLTTDDKLYAWGYYSTYAGTPSISESPIDITSRWTDAGLEFPINQMVGNYNTLHIIDANGYLFASGSNTMGEVGNNDGFKFWASKSPDPFHANWNNGENMVNPPVQIPGRYKNIQTGSTIAFYLYVQDMGDNWYSWGRNKAMSLGNGKTLHFFGGQGYDDYPNAKDVHAPTRVNPESVAWTVEGFDPEDDLPPLTWPGVNQYLINETQTQLTGSASQQQPGPTPTVTTTFLWTKVSRPVCTIVDATNPETIVTNLQNGTYQFRLTSTSSNGLSSFEDVFINNMIVEDECECEC